MRNWSPLVHGRTTSKHELTRLTTARTWGKPPPSPLYYTLCLATGLAPKCHFVLGTPNESPEIPTIGIPTTLGAHNLCANLRLRWGLKQSCSPHRKLSNGMLHTTCTQGNQSDSRLVVIDNQIANWTPCPSFAHNLCFKCPNGSFEPILDI
jgi:hypothetical protein